MSAHPSEKRGVLYRQHKNTAEDNEISGYIKFWKFAK
jgi:hypothetical protein